MVIVWYVEFSGKQTISQKVRDASKNAFNVPLKMLQIVYLCCRSTLPVVYERENFGWKYQQLTGVISELI